MIEIHDNETFSNENCLLCGKHYKHRIVYHRNADENDMPKEAEFLTHCANCRTLLRRVKETRHKLNELETEIEYYVFMKDK